jgi:hypothetical protein
MAVRRSTAGVPRVKNAEPASCSTLATSAGSRRTMVVISSMWLRGETTAADSSTNTAGAAGRSPIAPSTSRNGPGAMRWRTSWMLRRASTKSLTGSGFSKNWWAIDPTRDAASGSEWPESTTRTMSGHRTRTSPSSAVPSISGMRMSDTMTSTGSPPSWARASKPEPAVDTTQSRGAE